MGKYDGILIMSDMDGTLATGREITEENQTAIRRFQSEGGKFTVCSGRACSYFDSFREMILPNAPICAYNGALIVDSDGRVIKESFLDASVLGLVESVMKSGPMSKLLIYTKENGEPCSCEIDDFVRNFDEYSRMHHYKVVLVGENEESTLRAKAFAESLLSDEYFAARSWPTGLEILKKTASKAEALKLLKSYTSSSLAVAAGDFENDIDMISAADIGYAVENAVPCVKAVADRITVSCSESAIAKIIDDLAVLRDAESH